MTDGNTYAINKYLDEREDYDALQEVTAELEQAEARIEELEAKLAKAVGALEGLMIHEPDYADTLWRDARTTLTELKGKDDE